MAFKDILVIVTWLTATINVGTGLPESLSNGVGDYVQRNTNIPFDTEEEGNYGIREKMAIGLDNVKPVSKEITKEINDASRQNTTQERNDKTIVMLELNKGENHHVTENSIIIQDRRNANIRRILHDTHTNSLTGVKDSKSSLNASGVKQNQADRSITRERFKRYLPLRLLGQPPSTTPHTPFMVAEANSNRYQYMPMKDDGTVEELDPCPPPSPPSGGGGSNVFALLTFSVVTANALMNAVVNVNSNNNNNNNNENNNNDNANNENISSNLDSNTNDNMIMGRAFKETSGNSTLTCTCPKEGKAQKKKKKRKRAIRKVRKGFQIPKELLTCAPRIVCEAFRTSSTSISDISYFLANFSGLATSFVAVSQEAPFHLLQQARIEGLQNANCSAKYPCSLVN